jgi:hypothetical protein
MRMTFFFQGPLYKSRAMSELLFKFFLPFLTFEYFFKDREDYFFLVLVRCNTIYELKDCCGIFLETINLH